MKSRKTIVWLVLAAILVSCEFAAPDGSTAAVMPEETTVRESSVLFNEDGENKVFVFETNDTNYLNANGYTFWMTKEVNESDSFKTISVKLCKESGRMEAGFGIVFCSQEIDGKSFMLSVLINSNGLYTVGKVFDGSFSHINRGWKNSNYINKGYGMKNEILVSYDDTKKNFQLEINGYKTTTFTVSEKIVFKNSKLGFAVIIANNENFPNDSVKVTFEK